MRKNTPCIWEGFQNCALNITWRTLFKEMNSCRWFVSLFPSSLYYLFKMDTIGGFSFYIHSWRYFFLNIFPVLWKEYVFYSGSGWWTGEDVPRQFQLPSLRIRSLPWGAPGTRIHSLQFKLNSLAPFLMSILTNPSMFVERGWMITRFDVCEKDTWRTMNLIVVLLK